MHLRYFSNEVNRPHDGRIPLFLLPLSLRSLTLIENKKHYVEDYFVYFGKTRSVINWFPNGKKHVDQLNRCTE